MEQVEIPSKDLLDAAEHIKTNLGPADLKAVGGSDWWQWRPKTTPLKAEWIGMRKDYNEHKRNNEPWTRSMLYVHGGAYYFGSVGEHRYQMQRHARKLQARVLAPEYRLAPQYPFPCGLHDCLASYLYLLSIHQPEEIILAGDSAGAGMVVSMLCILRDQGLPLPAGAILLSPWVDLTHSFPSVSSETSLDYVPAHGFLHRPSISWPPPNSDDMRAMQGNEAVDGNATQSRTEKAKGFSVDGDDDHNAGGDLPQQDQNLDLSISIDGNFIVIKDQIQMYAPNALLSHPLVSPVMQPSLGGLPPLCILAGGGEMLRDEQIYLAHKAAAPTKYPLSAAALAAQKPGAAEIVNKYPPTYVQLQVWDDMCHVAPTLSFTRPAKYMYRSVAQFGAWALARAQNKEMSIVDDDDISIISVSTSASSSSSSSSSSNSSSKSSRDEDPESSSSQSNLFSSIRRLSNSQNRRKADISDQKPSANQTLDVKTEEPKLKPLQQSNRTGTTDTLTTSVGKAGDPLPPFTNYMIRERVTRHGEIFPLAEASSLAACTMKPSEVGTIKPGPVSKWMSAQKTWAQRYAKEKRSVQEQRIKDMKEGGYVDISPGERPPPSALAGRRTKAMLEQEERAEQKKEKKSRAMAMWSGWGSAHDEDAIEREEERKTSVLRRIVKPSSGAAANPQGIVVHVPEDGEADVAAPAALGAPLVATNSDQRPAIGNLASPFKLAAPMSGDQNPSMVTLTDQPGVIDASKVEPGAESL